jgi:type IV secretory pathway component VirB8
MPGMNDHSREGLETYCADAASWNRDRVQAQRSSQRIAWRISGKIISIFLAHDLDFRAAGVTR